MGLSTSELTQLRNDAESFLPDTCTIQTVTRTRTTDGGWEDSFANTYTSVECRLAPVRIGQSESLESEQIQAVSGWVLTLHHDQTVDETMRIVHDSETFEIVRIEDTHSNRTARRVYLRKAD